MFLVITVYRFSTNMCVVGVRSRVVELGTSTRVVAGSNPAQTKLASTVERREYSLRSCSPNDVKYVLT